MCPLSFVIFQSLSGLAVGKEGKDGERKEEAVFLPPGGIKSLGAGDWRAALWSSRDQGESWEFKYLGNTL